MIKSAAITIALAFWLWPLGIWAIDFMAVFITGQTLIVAAYDIYLHGVGGILWLLIAGFPVVLISV